MTGKLPKRLHYMLLVTFVVAASVTATLWSLSYKTTPIPLGSFSYAKPLFSFPYTPGESFVPYDGASLYWPTPINPLFQQRLRLDDSAPHRAGALMILKAGELTLASSRPVVDEPRRCLSEVKWDLRYNLPHEESYTTPYKVYCPTQWWDVAWGVSYRVEKHWALYEVRTLDASSPRMSAAKGHFFATRTVPSRGATYPLLMYENTLVSFSLWVPLALFLAYPVLFLTIALFRMTPWSRRNRRRKKGLCIHCGYDLTGNVTGRCPECGKAI